MDCARGAANGGNVHVQDRLEMPVQTAKQLALTSLAGFARTGTLSGTAPAEAAARRFQPVRPGLRFPHGLNPSEDQS